MAGANDGPDDAGGADSGIDRVLVAGATGPTGRHVLDVLLERGYEPKAITRSSQRANRLQTEDVDAIAGDLLVPGDARRAVRGVDAVITAVGTSVPSVLRAQIPGVGGPDRFVDGAGNVTLLEAAEAAGVEHVVMVSSLGVEPDPSSWMGSLFRLVLGPIPGEKARAEDAIRAADPTHTILRPGALLDVLDPLSVGRLRVGRAGAGVWGTVPRRTVAELCVAALSTPAAANETFEVARNPLSVGEDAGIDWDR